MSKKFLKTLSIIMAVACMVSILSAQRQTGSIVGTVADEDGLVLPGVAVSIVSPALILPEMNAVTNERGIYRFPSLSPGLYDITYEMEGMDTLVRKDIRVSVGQTVAIDAELRFKSIEENIIVTGESPNIDKSNVSIPTNLDSEFIDSIPAGRDLGSYLNMAPGMIREAESGAFWLRGTAGMGGSVRDNKFTLDGIDLNDPVTGIQMVEIGVDVMNEVSVESGGLTAEYGGVTGAVVNVISKSGGNEFSGSATFYYRHKSLQSDNTQGTPLEGSAGGYQYVYEPGLTFGGPIIKDKLWFFAGGSYIKKAQLISGFPYDKDEDIPVVEAYPHGFGKLSFQPDQNNKFALTYNFSSESHENFYASSFHTEDNTWEYRNPVHAFNLIWTRFFSSTFFTDIRFNYVDWMLDQHAHEGETRPLMIDLLSNRWVGGFGQKNKWNQKRYNFKLDGTLFVDNFGGSHEFKAGLEYNLSHYALSNNFISQQEYGFSTILTLGDMPYIGVENYNVDSKNVLQDAHFFIQDAWTVSKRLTLSLGLRLSRQWLTIPTQNEAEGPQSIAGYAFNRSVTEAYSPIKWTSLDPRIGVIFDLTGDGKTVLKASYGRFTSAMLSLYADYVNPNSYASATYIITPNLTPLFLIGINYPQIGKVEYGDHKLGAPYNDEITIALERELVANWYLGIRYIKKWSRDLIEGIDSSQLDIDSLMNEGELAWTNWEQVAFVDPFDGQQKYFWSQKQALPADIYLLNPPGAYRDFDGLEVKLTKRYSEGWSLMASYVYGHSRGLVGTDYFDAGSGTSYYDNPNSHVNAIGRFPMDIRHQIKLQGLVHGPLGINLSSFIRYFSGTRYTRSVNSIYLGVPVGQGQAAILAEERGSRGYPAQLIADVRLEKTFSVNQVTLSAFADVFNLFNANKATQYHTASGSPAYNFEEIIAIQNPRVFRLGAKISF